MGQTLRFRKTFNVAPLLIRREGTSARPSPWNEPHGCGMGGVDRDQSADDRIIEDQFKKVSQLRRSGFKTIVTVSEDKSLHIQSAHVLELQRSEGRIDLLFEISAELSGVLLISLDDFFEVPFAEIKDRRGVGQRELLQLLLLCWRYALVDSLCEFIAFQSRSLQAHQRVRPEGNFLSLSLELIPISSGGSAGRHHLKSEPPAIALDIPFALGWQGHDLKLS